MSENSEQERDELIDEDLEEANGEAVPDREAMSLITPFVDNPGFRLPVEPPE